MDEDINGIHFDVHNLLHKKKMKEKLLSYLKWLQLEVIEKKDRCYLMEEKEHNCEMDPRDDMYLYDIHIKN